MDSGLLVVLAFVVIAVAVVLWSNLQRILWWTPIRAWLQRNEGKPKPEDD